MTASVCMLALGFVAACGDEGEQAANAPSETGGGGLTKVSLRVAPQINFAPLQIGIDEGFFKENGIDLDLQFTANGINNPPALVAGQIQAAGFTWGSFPVVAAAGLPLVAVGPMDTAAAEAESDTQKIVSLEESGITSVEQLEGKTVGVNSVGGLAELQIRKAAETAGIDPKSVKPLVVPFPTMAAALRAKRVDAVAVVEPFLTDLIEGTDVNTLAGANVSIQPSLPFGCILMAKSYVDENPDVVRRFQLALAKTLEHASANEDQVRAVLPTFSKIPPEKAEKVTLPEFVATVDMAGIQAQADALHEFGFLEEKVDMSKVVVPFPLPETN